MVKCFDIPLPEDFTILHLNPLALAYTKPLLSQAIGYGLSREIFLGRTCKLELEMYAQQWECYLILSVFTSSLLIHFSVSY